MEELLHLKLSWANPEHSAGNLSIDIGAIVASPNNIPEILYQRLVNTANATQRSIEVDFALRQRDQTKEIAFMGQ